MKLSFITDEATQSFEEAVAFAGRLGFAGLELRSVEEQPIDRIAVHTLREWRNRLEAEGLAAACLSSTFFKCGFGDSDGPEMDKLSRLCDAADILGCGLIRGFAFFRPEEGALPADVLASRFEKPAVLLRARGKRLLLEADPSVNTANHASLGALLDKLDRKCFGAVYDPGNNLFDPQREPPYPDGYDAIRPCLAHVHVKDAVLEPDGVPRCVAPGKGLVDWPRVLRRLSADGYDGWLSIEPHYRKQAVLTEEQMRLPLGSRFTAGGMEAARESGLALASRLAEMESEMQDGHT